MVKEVVKLEALVNKNFNKENATNLIAEYDKFITTFPEDTSRKGYIVNAAEVSILKQDSENALKFINLFLKDYPDDKRAPELQFKKAMVYDLLLHDGLRAVAEYNIFIKNYPSHPLRKDAEYAIFSIQDPEGYMQNILKSQGARDTLNN